MIKHCPGCLESKAVADFHKDKSTKDGLKSYCKSCAIARKERWRLANLDKAREQMTRWRHANPEALKEMTARHRTKHRDTINAKVRDWRIKNPEKKRAGMRVTMKKRRNADPLFRMLSSLRARTRDAFKCQDLVKNKRTVEFLGCTPEQLQAHLALQLRPWMTLENYGSVWQIDHIIPCARFDLSNPDHVRACFHYTNLQPLLAEENLAKRDGPHNAPWGILIDQQLRRAV